MKTPHKGFISPLLLGLVVALVIGGGAYAYAQKKQGNQSEVERPVARNILPNTPYKDLTDYEKTLVDRFLQNPEFHTHLMEVRGFLYSENPNLIALKFYDEKTAVFSISPGEYGTSLEIYSIDTLKNTNKEKMISNTGEAEKRESNSYIVSISNYDSFIFYQKGATDFQRVPNSSLDPKNETYLKEIEPGIGVWDFTFDEPTKTITASVFNLVNKEIPSPKIRTVKFILP